MIDFASPRFAGNTLLEEILNDPNTGSKKLRKNSEVDAVRRVQKALFDLGWSLRIDEPAADEQVVVDGAYGLATSVDAAGQLETALTGVWTRGWTSVVPIELLGHAALVSYKGGSGTVEVGFVVAGAPA